MTYRLSFCFAVLLILSAGCGGSSKTVQIDPYALSERNLFGDAARLTAPAPDSAAAVRRVLYAAQRMREDALMPPFPSSFLLPREAGQGAHVLGYVPGRDPSHAGHLVIVAADLNTSLAAAVLETARRLAREALDTQVPERTVLAALWTPPRTGSTGLGDFLAHPTWAHKNIDRVLFVTADSVAAQRAQTLGEAHDIVVEWVAGPAKTVTSPAAEADLAAFAEALYAQTRAHSLVADTLAVSGER